MPTPSTMSPAHAIPRDWLSFRVGAEEYGVDILRVQEIRTYEEPTRLVNAPPCVLGVIDLRGAIVPLLDLRKKFGLKPLDAGGAPVVIVVFIADDVVGLVVDGVNDVVTLGEEHLRPMPALSQGATDHVMALATFDERTLILTDISLLGELADLLPVQGG